LDLSAAASIGSVNREFTHCDNRGLGDHDLPSPGNHRGRDHGQYASMGATQFGLFGGSQGAQLIPGGLYLTGVTSGFGAVYVDGNSVVSTRYPSTPSTLAGVIAVLQHHGLCN
jgi:hypothetical protein